MPVLIAEVERRLRALSSRESPADHAELVQLVRATLGGLEIDLLDVTCSKRGRFVARWRRAQGVLTEETAFGFLGGAPPGF